VVETQIRKALPGRIRLRLGDDAAAGATPLEFPARRLWPVGLIFGVMFAIARKLLIELWRYLGSGIIPEGAVLKGTSAA
jgi:hypothetical protein